MNSKPQRFAYIDAIRVFAMFCVIISHTAAEFLRQNYHSSTWHFANVLTAITSVNVPLFIMISGALLLHSSHTDSIRYTYQKRLPKLIVPFLVWSVVAAFCYQAYPNFIPNWKRFFVSLVYLPNQPTGIALWFMYAIISLYIIAPLIKAMTDHLSKRHIEYLLIIWFITNTILPTIASALPAKLKPIFTYYPEGNLIFIGGYLGYFVLGYYLTMVKIPKQKWLYLTELITVILMSALTWIQTTLHGTYTDSFKPVTSFLVVILASAVFLSFKSHPGTEHKWWQKLVTFYTPLSFGIYLFHNDVVLYLEDFWLKQTQLPGILAIVILSLEVIAIVTLVILMLNQIPGVRFIFNGNQKKQND